MESLSEYENQAIRTIKHYCRRKNLPFQQFLSDDYISCAIEALIKADLKYSPNYNTKLTTFRYKGVVLALLGMKKRKKQINTVSLESARSEIENKSMKRSNYPIDFNKELVEKIIDGAALEEPQKQFVELHFFENKNITDIAQICGCSKQNVNQTLERAILNMQKFAYKNWLIW